mgnify:FL=1
MKKGLVLVHAHAKLSAFLVLVAVLLAGSGVYAVFAGNAGETGGG